MRRRKKLRRAHGRRRTANLSSKALSWLDLQIELGRLEERDLKDSIRESEEALNAPDAGPFSEPVEIHQKNLEFAEFALDWLKANGYREIDQMNRDEFIEALSRDTDMSKNLESRGRNASRCACADKSATKHHQQGVRSMRNRRRGRKGARGKRTDRRRTAGRRRLARRRTSHHSSFRHPRQSTCDCRNRFAADEAPLIYADAYIDWYSDFPIDSGYLRGHYDLYSEIQAGLGNRAQTPEWVRLFEDIPVLSISGNGTNGTLSIENIKFYDEGFTTLEAGGIEPGEESVREFMHAVALDVERLFSNEGMEVVESQSDLDIRKI